MGRKIHTIKAKGIEGLRNQKTHACRQAKDIMFFNDRKNIASEGGGYEHVLLFMLSFL